MLSAHAILAALKNPSQITKYSKNHGIKSKKEAIVSCRYLLL